MCACICVAKVVVFSFVFHEMTLTLGFLAISLKTMNLDGSQLKRIKLEFG